MKKKLYERAALFRAVRFFFESRAYLEVETPLMQPVLIPEATIMPVVAGGHLLQTSPELCMKRLLAAGYGSIFQICKCFRAQERGRLHLPEFSMLEWYRIHGEYQSLMAETVELLHAIGLALLAEDSGFKRDILHLLGQEPQYITVADAFQTYAEMPVAEALAEDRFDAILVEYIEPNLGHTCPCFLYDYPIALGSLARAKGTNPDLAERFELYVGGVELANGFSELTDVGEQRSRFQAEITRAKEQGLDWQLPERFLADLQVMPKACGIALGLDRLLMLVTGATAIDEVVSFTLEEL